jgi:hypothetical protein
MSTKSDSHFPLLIYFTTDSHSPVAQRLRLVDYPEKLPTGIPFSIIKLNATKEHLDGAAALIDHLSRQRLLNQ